MGMVFGHLPRVEGGLGSRCIDNSDCQVVYQHTNNDIIIIIMIMVIIMTIMNVTMSMAMTIVTIK